jgi:hypothetical protein
MLPAVTVRDADGNLIISAGGTLYKSQHDETWHGFLYDLLQIKLTAAWCGAELSKSVEDMHVLMRWFKDVCDRELDKEAKFTRWRADQDVGSALAFRSLAYDVFCLEQGGGAPASLLARLKSPDQFEGARYEAWAAACVLRAGWKIEFEDESDRRSSHCEFTAIHPRSGKKYSVECKRRHRDLDHPEVLKTGKPIKLDITGLMADALKKKANHDRIIFVDVNMPPHPGTIIEAPWIKAFKRSKELLEQQPAYRANNAPHAFVLATNHPYHYVAKIKPDPKSHFVATSFNKPDLYADGSLLPSRAPEVLELMKSIAQHFTIPEDFAPR